MHKVVVWVQQVLVPWLGPSGLFVACFLDSSFLSFPEISDLLVITAAAASPASAWAPVAMATGGSLAGCCVLWWFGKRGGQAFLVRRFGEAHVARTRAAFERWDALALAVPAMLPPPMPFKIFVFSAGVFGVPLRRFVLTLAVARGLRYVFWAAMGIAYGERAREMLDVVDEWFGDHLPVVMGLAAGALLLGLGMYFWHRRARAAHGVE